MSYLPQSIFRAYDIRGLVPDQLNDESARAIGQGFARFLNEQRGLKNPRIVVGRDNRTHGKGLQQAFMKALTASGCDVTDIGLTTTPLLYFSTVQGGFDAGCNVSASHNPAEYNGFKLVGHGAHAICGEELQTLYRLSQTGAKTEGRAGKSKPADFFEPYLATIKRIFPDSQGLKVVVDTGNGVAGRFYPAVLEALGNTVIPLHATLDGTFPNHPPDPIVEANLADLKQAVREHRADLGIAFDGDGDRLGVVDETGRHWNSDYLAMLLTRDLLTRHPGARVVFTVSNSQLLFDLTRKWGGEPVMCPVGHSYVENAMRTHQAALGGEQSGHFFLPEEYFAYDDACVAACRLLETLKSAKKGLSELFKALPSTHPAPERRPYCPDQQKFKIMARIRDYFLNKYPESSTLDGIRIDFGSGAWAGIRVSNTSPCLSVCLEAPGKKKLSEIEDIVLSHLKTYPEIEL